MVAFDSSKVDEWVRFPSLAPNLTRVGVVVEMSGVASETKYSMEPQMIIEMLIGYHIRQQHIPSVKGYSYATVAEK